MRNRLIAFFTFSALLGTTFTYAQSNQGKNQEQQRYFDINKNIEIFNSVVREMDMFYVDSLDINKTIRTGIDNMLGTLDPYTEYYNEDDMKEFSTQITGEYAGVGAIVSFKDGRVTIIEPYGDKPAAKAGLKAGDVILEIDGKDMTTCDSVPGEVFGRTLSSFVSNNEITGRIHRKIIVVQINII